MVPRQSNPLNPLNAPSQLRSVPQTPATPPPPPTRHPPPLPTYTHTHTVLGLGRVSCTFIIISLDWFCVMEFLLLFCFVLRCMRYTCRNFQGVKYHQTKQKLNNVKWDCFRVNFHVFVFRCWVCVCVRGVGVGGGWSVCYLRMGLTQKYPIKNKIVFWNKCCCCCFVTVVVVVLVVA